MLALILGIAGMVIILFVFILDEFETRYNEKTITNNLLSTLGACLLIFYAVSLNAWPFVILNAIWLSVALVKLSRLIKKRYL